MQFNLLREPWIPVNQQGQPALLSLKDVFEQAHRVSSLTHANPLVVAGLLRMMLAVVYRVYGYRKSENWVDLVSCGQFGAEVMDYLDSQQSRFDLFSPTHPFFQVPDFTKDKANSVKKLTPDFTTANNKTLFNHQADHQLFSLSPQEAALYLLVCQYFSLGGGISGSSNLFGKHPNYANAPLVGGATIYVAGRNLFETLMFNYTPFSTQPSLYSNENDRPVWEQDTPTSLKPRLTLGISDYLTWPARFMRLLPDEEGRVSEIYIAQGLPSPVEVEREPYFAYKAKKDGSHYPFNLHFGRALWRDSAAIYFRGSVDLEGSRDHRPCGIRWASQQAEFFELNKLENISCDVYSLENNKANPVAWYSQHLPLNIRYLIDQPEKADHLGALLFKSVKYAEGTFTQLRDAFKEFATRRMPAGARDDDITRELKSYQLEKWYWPQLDHEFSIFFKKLVSDPNGVIEEWNKNCWLFAYRVFDQLMPQLAAGGGREFRAYAFANRKFKQRPSAPIDSKKAEERAVENEKRMEESMDQNIKNFAAYLNNLIRPEDPDLAALANLRRTLNPEPRAWIGAMPYLAKYWPEKERDAFVYATVAGLFASHRLPSADYKNLGDSLAELWKKEGEPSPSLELRVKTLLESEVEELPGLIRSFFEILKTESIPVDYRILVRDLLNWSNPKRKTQLSWAKSFWAPQKTEIQKQSEPQQQLESQ